jgi:hypothetical protein
MRLANVLALSISSPPAGFIEPCLPTLAHAVPDGSRWAFEIIHDGFRFSPGATGPRAGGACPLRSESDQGVQCAP